MESGEHYFGELENPCTEVYRHMKELILDSDNMGSGLVPFMTAGDPTPQNGDVDPILLTDQKFIDRLALSSTIIARKLTTNVGEDNKHRCVACDGEDMHPMAGAFRVMLRELLEHNGLRLGRVYRAAFNLTWESDAHPDPHIDHYHPHMTVLIYLNDAVGDTVVCKNKVEEFLTFDEKIGANEYCYTRMEDVEIGARITPKEDRAVIFDGANYHFNYTPDAGTGGRAVFVATFELL